MPLLPDNDPYKRWNDYRAQKQAELKPVSEPDLRTVERIQNYKIAELEYRIAQLEAQLSQRPDWNVPVPPFTFTRNRTVTPVRIIDGVKHFDQAEIFEPAPSPIDGARDEYLEGEGE